MHGGQEGRKYEGNGSHVVTTFPIPFRHHRRPLHRWQRIHRLPQNLLVPKLLGIVIQ